MFASQDLRCGDLLYNDPKWTMICPGNTKFPTLISPKFSRSASWRSADQHRRLLAPNADVATGNFQLQGNSACGADEPVNPMRK